VPVSKHRKKKRSHTEWRKNRNRKRAAWKRFMSMKKKEEHNGKQTDDS